MKTKGSYLFTRNKGDFLLAYITGLFSFLKKDKRKSKIMSQFKLELIANPIRSLGDREKIALNSLNLRIFIYKARIIILIISNNISTFSREYSKNK